ncbi:MAG TPA: O-antigen ligase family protein, partial [bacterium]|nr:O-antigen ligase family protein [bacterium]
QDLRRFAMFFAVAGLLASFVGMATRLMGGAAALTPATLGEDVAEGAGGRIGGGWLGLNHPNMFAALLIMTMPMWFFAINHLKHGFRRLLAEVAVVNGFMGLMFTYSRSAWFGSILGIGLVGLADRKSLGRIFLFGAIFAIAAQTVVLFTMDMNLVEVILMRFQQLESSTFSARPYIYASSIEVVKAHPLLGVGAGAFRAHAPAIPLGWVPSHSHNVFLAYAAESGIPTALAFIWMTLRIFAMSINNLKRIGRVPGYGFLALGSCAAFIALTAQSMAVQIFHHRMLGFGYYALLAVIVVLDRMIREGQFDDMKPSAGGEKSSGSVWVGS